MKSSLNRKNVFLSPYRLQAKGSLNRSQGNEIDGYFLKVEINGKSGYSVLQTWPNLGDPPLDEIINDPNRFFVTEFLQRPLYFAELDRRARESGQSLLASTNGPTSHQTLVTDSEIEEGSLFKIKMGFGVDEDFKKFSKIKNHLGSEKRFRLDFNSVDARPFLDRLVASDFECIDFLEDPAPEDFKVFQNIKANYPIRIALDRKSRPLSDYNNIDDSIIDYIVLKPLKENFRELKVTNKQKLCFTSNMDHLLGVFQANYEAISARNESYQLTECGFLSFRIFGEDVLLPGFSVQSHALCFTKDYGVGFGMNHLLDSIDDWKPL